MAETTTKRCPHCAEEIRSEAVKCRYCGSVLSTSGVLSRPWHRSRRGKMIAGVCAGLAEEFGISVTILRVGFLLSALFSGGMGLIIYVVLWMVMPYREPEGAVYDPIEPSWVPVDERRAPPAPMAAAAPEEGRAAPPPPPPRIEHT
jgi:phage shock protein PspC (stress-responsive transcriptional regulator)